MNAMTIHQWADKLDEMAIDGIGTDLHPDGVVELAAVLREHLAARSHEALFLGHINGAPVGLHGTRESVQALEAHLTTPPKVAVSDELIRDACFAYMSTDTVTADWKPHADDIRRMTYAANFLSARLAQPVVTPDPTSFACYLIDKHEKDTIYEESVQQWLADFFNDPRYAKSVEQRQPQAVVDVDEQLRVILRERNHRDDGDTAALLERVRHMSRGDRDCIAMNETWHKNNGADAEQRQPQGAQGELPGNSGELGAQSEVARLQTVIERDRTIFCNLLVRLKNAVKGRQHLGDENARAASGYTYDEDGFIKEFGDAYAEIMSALEHAHRVFQDFTDCPKGNAILEAQAEANAILSKQHPAESAAVPEDAIRQALLTHVPRITDRKVDAVIAYVTKLSAAPTLAGKGSYQQRVAEWMRQAFIPSLYSNMTERGDRLLEEVLELLQSHGYDPARVATLVQYVFGRPAGEPAQEVGGVMVTLAGYCFIAGLDMHAAGETELARIGQPEVMAKIRAKQEAKNALHFDTPLPGQPVESEVSAHG